MEAPQEKKRYNARLIIRRMKKKLLLRQRRELEKQGFQISGFPGYQFGQPSPLPKGEMIIPIHVAEGIEIAAQLTPTGKPIRLEEEKEHLAGIDLSYSLTSVALRPGEQPYVSAAIRWQEGQVLYSVVEPPLSPEEKGVIDWIKKELEERLDIDFAKLGEIKAKQVLKEEIQKSFMAFPQLPEERRVALTYYIERDLLGLGKIEPLMNDENIEDISCDGVLIPLYIYHRDPRFGSLRTNIIFETADEVNSFVEILAQKCKKSISIAEPLLDGALPDGSRVQATLGTDIARKGSNFTIRKFTSKPLTPVHLIKYKTMDSTQLAYLWLAVENGKSLLISGGTATGKTSLLNALSLFIRPSMKVVSIEDTSELRLPHPHWIPHVARSPLSIKGTVGEVTLFDLLKSSLRQRPDYIIVGEVRGAEAFVLFQQIATGHAAMATIHAASIPQLVDRLITPPISLPPTLLENIDIVVFLTLSRLRGSYVRRTDSILEIVGIKNDRPETVMVFEWKPAADVYEVKERSIALKKIAVRLGITEESIQEEIGRRKRILEWMFRKEVFDYRDVSYVISTYYTDPERVMEAVDTA